MKLHCSGWYVDKKVMNLCKAYGWDYIIRYKEGWAKSIEEEYQAIPEKNRTGNAEYVNDIIYQEGSVNVLQSSISSSLRDNAFLGV